MLVPLVAFIGDMLLERKILFHVILLVVMRRISRNVTAVTLSEMRPKLFLGMYPVVTSPVSCGFMQTQNLAHFALIFPTKSCGFAGTRSLLLIIDTAGRAINDELFGGLVVGTVGRSTNGRLFIGLVTGIAGRNGYGSLYLIVPAKEIRKGHDYVPSSIFVEWCSLLTVSL